MKDKKGVYSLILNRRSIRKFKQKPVSLTILKKILNAARLAPSGANLQPLQFVCIKDKEVGERVFGTLSWAGYIAPRGTPGKGERPTAYILTIVDTSVRKDNYQYDVGAAMENMILAALEEGIGSCWIASINRPELAGILDIPSSFLIDSILALGYPAENPKMEKFGKDCRYWKDSRGRLHVPKRGLDRTTHFNRF